MKPSSPRKWIVIGDTDFVLKLTPVSFEIFQTSPSQAYLLRYTMRGEISEIVDSTLHATEDVAIIIDSGVVAIWVRVDQSSTPAVEFFPKGSPSYQKHLDSAECKYFSEL